MIHITEPTLYLDRLQQIDMPLLQQLGVRALLVDMDNTLVAYGSTQASQNIQTWIDTMKQEGIELLLFTNASPTRALALAHSLGIPCVPRAGKPWFVAFIRAGRQLRTPKKQWAAVGDQILTDVLGANCLGIKSIYVTPLSHREWGWTRLMRRLERRILAARGR